MITMKNALGALYMLREDFMAIRRQDPSIPKGIRGILEILLCAPGYWAVSMHRIFHLLYVLRIPVIPRLLSLVMRWITGIEIHPGARLGGGIFIDHGMGVVIGESARVGSGVLIYQGVTLGARGDEKEFLRHPLVEDNVVIGSGAKVLGNITIGKGSRIGAGAVVLQSVLPESTVVGMPASVVKVGNRVLRSPENLFARMEKLEEELASLKVFLRKERSSYASFENSLEGEAS